MTRKDFNLIAETLKSLPTFNLKPLDNWGKDADAVRVDILISRFADALSTTNPNFDRNRFIAACKGGN